MKVLKFGSATIGSAEKIKQVCELIKPQTGNIVVLSSMAGVADLLEEISDYYYNKNAEAAIEIVNKLYDYHKKLIDNLFAESKSKIKALELLQNMIEYIKSFFDELFTLFEKKALMAQGELISVELITLFLNDLGISTHILPALDYMRMDKSENPDSVYIKEKLRQLITQVPEGKVLLTQGYICRNAYGEIDDLQKGGSDYTAAIVGAAIEVEEIQIWNTEEVLLNNDPLYIKNTKVVRSISFDEAAELAYFGSKILHPMCILPAKLAGVPVRLLSVNNAKDRGTLISNETEAGTVKAIGVRDNITAIKLKSGKMLLAHGYLRRVFEVFEKYQTSIDMLASSEIGISVTVDDCKNLDSIVDELRKYGSVSVDSDMVIISVVGDFLMKNENVGSSILDAIKNIPVRMVSYGGSNLSFSFLIEEKNKQHAILLLNDKLFN